MRILLFLAFLVGGAGAEAFQMSLSNISDSTGGNATAAANLIVNQFNNSIASTSNTKSFLGAVSNSSAMAGRSYLAQGADDHNNFSVALGGSLALALGEGGSLSSGIRFPANQLPPIGVGAQSGVTLGIPGRVIKIPRLDASRLTYRVSFSSLDLSSAIGRGMSMSATQFSLGGSYSVFNPVPWTPLIRYNGIRFSTGFAYSSFSAGYQTPFSLSQTSGGSTVTLNQNIDLKVSSSIFSFTNEAITGLRFLWFLNLYGGLGLDFNFGSSSLTGGSSGTMSGTGFSATANVTGDSASYGPSLVQVRFLTGMQFDLGPLGLYVQGQISTPSAYAVNFGLSTGF